MSLTRLQTSVEAKLGETVCQIIVTTPKISKDEIDDINIFDCKYELVKQNGSISNITEHMCLFGKIEELNEMINWQEVWEDLKEIATLDNYLDIDPNA